MTSVPRSQSPGQPGGGFLVHKFEASPEDHCETPGDAYDDLAKALEWVACEKLGKAHKGDLKIYDPYFCAGAVKRHLAARGFPRVYNENEDFYAMVEAGTIPEYDVLVTNPPYSGEHMERILEFVSRCGKPWFLLVPNFVYVNPCYAKHLGPEPCRALGVATPLFLTPSVARKDGKARYEYAAPEGSRKDKAVATAPFMSFWYAGVGKPQDAANFVRWWRLEAKRAAEAATRPLPDLSVHARELPHRFRAQYDPTRRRVRKKQREAFERRKRKRRAEDEAERKAGKPCRFGGGCTREGCWFSHPARATGS